MTMLSHCVIFPSHRKYIEKQTAIAKKTTSLTNDFLATLKGRTRAIEPATTAVMKEAAPMSSPTARDPELIFIAAKVLNTSGEPFPNAKNVTPAYKKNRNVSILFLL